MQWGGVGGGEWSGVRGGGAGGVGWSLGWWSGRGRMEFGVVEGEG